MTKHLQGRSRFSCCWWYECSAADRYGVVETVVRSTHKPTVVRSTQADHRAEARGQTVLGELREQTRATGATFTDHSVKLLDAASTLISLWNDGLHENGHETHVIVLVGPTLWHDAPQASGGGVATAKTPFIGMPDDVARLAVQRFLSCDLKARAHDRVAARWSRVETILSAATAVAASLAAVSFLRLGWLGIGLSVLVAILVPLQRSFGAAGRATEHRRAASVFSGLADSYERYLQLDIGPMAWRQSTENLENVRRHLDKLDDAVAVGSKEAPPVRSIESEQAETEVRGSHLVEYLSMSNVVTPPRGIWTR